MLAATSYEGFVYDTNNKLTSFYEVEARYDADGNMVSSYMGTFGYDSSNRLVSAGGHTYTYNAEGVRIRNLCTESDTTYVYDSNASLSRLLVKTENNVTTKYIYGLGLLAEETGTDFKVYHFDYRGSTVALTDSNGVVTDRFT